MSDYESMPRQDTFWFGFKDVWKVIVFDGFKEAGMFNRKDFGVLCGVISMLGILYLIVYVIVGLVIGG
jgi:hypothetical protein